MVYFIISAGFIYFIIIYALIIPPIKEKTLILYSKTFLPWICHCDFSFWLFYFLEDYLG